MWPMLTAEVLWLSSSGPQGVVTFNGLPEWLVNSPSPVGSASCSDQWV